MMMPWLYLDKEAASIKALKDFPGMRRILENHFDDTTETEAFLTATPNAILSHLRNMPNPKAFENKVVSTLHLIDVVEERYLHALEYMTWFLPAWEALSEENRYILSEFFFDDSISRAEAVERIGNRLGYEKTAIYTRKDKAVDNLAFLLYGR